MNLADLKAELDAALALPTEDARVQALKAWNAKWGAIFGCRPKVEPEPRDHAKAAAGDKD